MSDGLPYSKFCEAVMNDETGTLIKDFRRNPDYDLVVPGNRDGNEMFEHVELLKNEYPGILKFMPVFQEKQGVFGNPKTYKFDIADKPLDVPLVIQIYYLALTMRYFGDLTGKNICEIGAGAGLQFKLITDIFSSVKYSFIDLKGAIYILRRYVEYLGRVDNVAHYIDCDFVQYCNFDYDIVTSDCGFNELHRDTQLLYIDKILNRSNGGRIAFYDSKIKVDGIESLTIYEVFQKLNKKTKTIKMDLRVPTLYWKEG